MNLTCPGIEQNTRPSAVLERSTNLRKHYVHAWVLYPCQQTNRTKLTHIWTEFATCVLQQNLIKSSWNCGNAETRRADLTAAIRQLMLPATYSEDSTTRKQHESCRMHCWMLDCDPLPITQQEITGAGLQKLDNACARTQILKMDWKVVYGNHAVLRLDAERLRSEEAHYFWQRLHRSVLACCLQQIGNWTNWVLSVK